MALDEYTLNRPSALPYSAQLVKHDNNLVYLVHNRGELW